MCTTRARPRPRRCKMCRVARGPAACWPGPRCCPRCAPASCWRVGRSGAAYQAGAGLTARVGPRQSGGWPARQARSQGIDSQGAAATLERGAESAVPLPPSPPRRLAWAGPPESPMIHTLWHRAWSLAALGLVSVWAQAAETECGGRKLSATLPTAARTTRSATARRSRSGRISRSRPS